MKTLSLLFATTFVAGCAANPSPSDQADDLADDLQATELATDSFGVPSASAHLVTLIDAINRHDVDGILATLDADYHGRVPLLAPGGDEVRGHEQVRPHWEGNFAFVPDIHVEIISLNPRNLREAWAETRWTGTDVTGAPFLWQGVIKVFSGGASGKLLDGWVYTAPVVADYPQDSRGARRGAGQFEMYETVESAFAAIDAHDFAGITGSMTPAYHGACR